MENRQKKKQTLIWIALKHFEDFNNRTDYVTQSKKNENKTHTHSKQILVVR